MGGRRDDKQGDEVSGGGVKKGGKGREGGKMKEKNGDLIQDSQRKLLLRRKNMHETLTITRQKWPKAMQMLEGGLLVMEVRCLSTASLTKMLPYWKMKQLRQIRHQWLLTHRKHIVYLCRKQGAVKRSSHHPGTNQPHTRGFAVNDIIQIQIHSLQPARDNAIKNKRVFREYRPRAKMIKFFCVSV